MTFVIVGLGNPGGEYAKTRHNAGRMLVEQIAKNEGFPEWKLRKTVGATSLVTEGKMGKASGDASESLKRGSPTGGKEKVTLILPETFMNHSGKSVRAFVKSKAAAKKLLVVRDDIDLPLGVLKMTFGRGAGGHKGVESIMRALLTNDFAQLKIGISRAGKKNQVKKPTGEDGVNKFVVGKFKPEEEAALKRVFKKATAALELFVTDGVEKATMEANTR